MFRVSIFLAFTFFFIFISLKITKKDYAFYNYYISKKIEREKPDIHQMRKKIQKDIWFFQDNKRKQCRIRCDESHFTFSQKTKRADELLYNICGWYQEDVGENGQKLRYFTSNEGIYSFMPHQFLSKEVQMSFLDESGADLPTVFNPDKAYMNAKVKKVLFNLKEDGASFKASHIKANFPNSKKGHVKSKKTR